MTDDRNHKIDQMVIKGYVWHKKTCNYLLRKIHATFKAIPLCKMFSWNILLEKGQLLPNFATDGGIGLKRCVVPRRGKEGSVEIVLYASAFITNCHVHIFISNRSIV